jgi:hypothetical protein
MTARNGQQAKPAIRPPGLKELVKQNRPFRPPARALGARVSANLWPKPSWLRSKSGLSAQRIYQDLVEESGFTDSCQSVKRFVRKLRSMQPDRVWRPECQPGEELQLDFGLGAPIDDAQGKTRRTWVLRLVLSYSRNGYSEAVHHKDLRFA